MILVKYLEELDKWYNSIRTDKDWANIQLLKNIEKNLGLTFAPQIFDSAMDTDGNVCMANSPEVRDEFKETFTPIELLDYIYAILHSPSYREKHKEFLKVDFSVVPYPADVKVFWELVRLGGELRQLHLLESPKVEDYVTNYPKVGSKGMTTSIRKKDWETISSTLEVLYGSICFKG